MNSKQKAFIELCIQYETDNVRAYMEAYGISEDRREIARVGSYKQLQNPTIAILVEKGIDDAKRKREQIRAAVYKKELKEGVATKEQVLLFLTNVMNNELEKQDTAIRIVDRITAAKTILEYEYPNTKKVDIGGNVSHTNLQAAIDAISKDITPPPTE